MDACYHVLNLPNMTDKEWPIVAINSLGWGSWVGVES